MLSTVPAFFAKQSSGFAHGCAIGAGRMTGGAENPLHLAAARLREVK